jgi:hypothetical protein
MEEAKSAEPVFIPVYRGKKKEKEFREISSLEDLGKAQKENDYRMIILFKIKDHQPSSQLMQIFTQLYPTTQFTNFFHVLN